MICIFCDVSLLIVVILCLRCSDIQVQWCRGDLFCLYYVSVSCHLSFLTELLSYIYICMRFQCPKLRVHPAPGAHISTAGCTILGGVHPVCARFLNHLVLWEVHPASAHNESLISDTGF